VTEKVIIAGSGGQGIMLLGKILAEAAMREKKFVTWLPSYGAEVRGGTSHCMVVISDQPIGSPYIDKANTLIMMNKPSLEKFKHRLNPQGLCIFNSSLIPPEAGQGIKAFSFPFTDIALVLGNIKIANSVALGCYIARKRIVNLKSALQVVRERGLKVKKDLILINQEALQKGFAL
jgi:2-oxoglutarate ferredoxin oxidoreductase subunit gamma